MAGGPMIQIWNEWATQILILLSFALQIFLFLFARTRRRGPSAVLKTLLWLAYLMADSTAIYTIGHLSISGSPREQKLAVFWAPFLLVHLGGQDTITAYALEDNQLWPRHLLNLGVQAFGVAYVLYNHITEIPTSLGLATGLMFAVGLIKYGERIWALKCATLDSIMSSIRESWPLPTYYSALPSRGAARAEERDEEELLLFAHGMLRRCKGAMVNFPVTLQPSAYDLKWNWKAVFKVVEMEMSLMYDIIYTKATVIHTWYGYLFRLVSPLATVTAFVLFQLSHNEDGYRRVDVAITYTLLVGAFLLDMASVFSTLGSTWTCNFLWTSGWSKLGSVILSLRRRVKAAAGNRGWSGSIGQFNLLHFCTRDRTGLTTRVAKMMRLKDWWNKMHNSETLVISEDIKELVFKHVWHQLMVIHGPRAEDEIQSPLYEKGMEEPIARMPPQNQYVRFGPESYEETARRRRKLEDALGFGAELQQVILSFQVFTDIFLLSRSGTFKDKLGATSSTYLKGIKVLSDYMVFLIARRANTIVGLELRSIFEATCDALEGMWHERGDETSFATREEMLACTLQNSSYRKLRESTIILQQGAIHAKLLGEVVDGDEPTDFLSTKYLHSDMHRFGVDMMERLMPDLNDLGVECRVGRVFNVAKWLALIFNGWVRLLIIVSIRCSRDAHARQISRGGELTTVVWLMEEHAAMFLKPPADVPRLASYWSETGSSEDLESAAA